MKRTISTLLLVLLCLTPVLTYGAECEDSCSDPVQLARMSPAILGAAGPVYTDCSQFPTGGSFYWNGDHASGDTFGCISVSATKEGAFEGTADTVSSGTDPGVASPDSAGQCFKGDSADDILEFTTPGDIVEVTEGTVQLDFYVSSSDNTKNLFNVTLDADNLIYINAYSTNIIRFRHTSNSTYIQVDSTSVFTDAQWTRVKFTWSQSSNKLGLKLCNSTSDCTNAYKTACASGCDVTDEDTITDFDPVIVQIKSNGDTVYIDNVKIWKTNDF